MSSMMRIDESLAVMAEAAQKSAAAQERRAAAEERRADADERCAVAIERYAAAAERAALVAEENLRDGRASRVELHAFFDKLAAELLPVVTAKIESALGASAEQAEEEEAEEEEEEGQQPVPVAVEAPAKPEPAPVAEPAPAPVEVKQEEEDKPATAEPVETASEDKAELAATYLQTSQFLRKFRAIQAEYMPPDEINREAQMKIAKNLNLPRLVLSTPEQRQKILDMYRAEMEKYYKTGKL